jgi:3-hydroxyacyl-CoA dehydrogenase
MNEPACRTIGLVGCGVIGASWAAYYLARGFDVRATDPDPTAGERLADFVAGAWPALERLGLAPGASRDRLRFEMDLSDALQGVDFVQENGPESLAEKRSIIGRISNEVPAEVIIASSSSGILISEIQDAAVHPERVVLGHPFNPPHLIPLVEVVGGRLTSPEVIAEALRFYRAIGKEPIHIKREMKGHLANRLQAALWREAIYLVAEGAATVADVDLAITEGPGLRWGLSGPFLNMQLSGGPRGVHHYLEHLGDAIEDWWADLGEVRLDAALNARIAEGVAAELSGRDPVALGRARDEAILNLLMLKRGGLVS